MLLQYLPQSLLHLKGVGDGMLGRDNSQARYSLSGTSVHNIAAPPGLSTDAILAPSITDILLLTIE